MSLIVPAINNVHTGQIQMLTSEAGVVVKQSEHVPCTKLTWVKKKLKVLKCALCFLSIKFGMKLVGTLGSGALTFSCDFHWRHIRLKCLLKGYTPCCGSCFQAVQELYSMFGELDQNSFCITNST